MKFKVTHKSPDFDLMEDVRWEAKRLVAKKYGLKMADYEMKKDYILREVDALVREMATFAEDYVGEYVTIEFDTEAGTATVVKE